MRICSNPLPVAFQAEGIIPGFLSLAPAGFPSPAEDYIEGEVNLHEQLVHNPLATFTLRASGNSMVGAGILDGATLVVDRSVDPYNGAIVIAVIDGEMYCKRLEYRRGRVFLVPANPEYQETDVTGRDDFCVWGVVIHAINSFRGNTPKQGGAQRTEKKPSGPGSYR